MRKMRRKIAVLLVFVLAFTMMPQNVLAAKKKVKLSKKSVTITVGKTVKVKLKNNKKKVKWTVTSGKKNVKLSKKKKTGVTIHGKKAGKAKVQAKVGKKKFVCKVTVKNADTNQNTDKNNGKKTAKPTVKPTEKPVLPSTPTPKPTEKPVLPSTPTPKPTEKPSLPSTPTPKPDNKPDPTPIETMMPPDETPAPTVKPESNYQGLYAEKEPLIVSSVAFEKDVPSFSLNYNDIYVISEEADSLKEFVPDVTKCTYNVYCYGKKAEVKSITDVVWHDDEEWQKPYYSFLLTAVQGGKEYKQTVTMKLVCEDSEEGSENGMTWLSLDADGEKYELEQSLHDEEGESGYYFKDKEVNTSKIQNAENIKLVGVYEEQQYTVNARKEVCDDYFVSVISDSFAKDNLAVGSGMVYIDAKTDSHFYIDAFTATKGEVNLYPGYSEECFVYEPALEKGKTLKDIFANVVEDLKIYRAVYNNVYWNNENIEIRNVVWHDEPYYDDKTDHGYYSFNIVLTVDGQENEQSYVLVEKQKTYAVSGKLTTEDGLPIAEAEVLLSKLSDEECEYTIETDKNGCFEADLSKGTYQFELGQTFTVEDSDVVHNEKLPVYKITGKVTRTGANTPDVPGFYFESEDSTCIYLRDLLGDDNRYYAYVQKGTYTVQSCDCPVDTVEVTGSETYDIKMELALVSGKGSGYYKFVDTEDENNCYWAFSVFDTYNVYLKPGTYYVKIEDATVDTIEVSLGEMTKDYEMYSCKGELLDMAGLQIPKDMYRNYEILVMRNEVVYKKLIMAPKFDEDDISGFKFDVLAGEYEFLHNGKSVGRMTVTDSNVVKDLTMPYKYVKIKMLDAEDKLISIYPTRRLKFASKGTSSISYYMDDDESGDYTSRIVLPTGDYQCVDYYCMPSIGDYGFTVDGSSDTVVINTNVYKISGSCKVNGTEVSDDTWVYLHKKGDATELSNYTFDEGKYEFYVEPGEYEIKVSLDSGIVTAADVTITNASVERDLELVE